MNIKKKKLKRREKKIETQEKKNRTQEKIIQTPKNKIKKLEKIIIAQIMMLALRSSVNKILGAIIIFSCVLNCYFSWRFNFFFLMFNFCFLHFNFFFPAFQFCFSWCSNFVHHGLLLQTINRNSSTALVNKKSWCISMLSKFSAFQTYCTNLAASNKSPDA